MAPSCIEAPSLGTCPELQAAFSSVTRGRAGQRLTTLTRIEPLLREDGPIGSIAAGAIAPGSRPVRAILFDKTAETNWALGWHQDRTICVKRRVEVEGFGA